MPEDTAKPKMPRRPSARKPAEAKPLRKQDKNHIDDVEFDCSILTMEEKACVLIAIEKDKESAAIDLGMTIRQVEEIMDSPQVRLYLQKLQAEELVQLAKLKVRSYRKVGISRSAIEQRLYELMMMDPDKTKGNIDGQVKAAAALADKFGFASEKDPLAGKSPEELKGIVQRGYKLIEGNGPVN